MAVVGVDEAGKGPVLGSMFAAAVRTPDQGCLPAGIRDSKDLTPERREALAWTLRGDDRIGVSVAEVPVERIDDPETDMNTLTVEAQAEALSGVVREGDRVLVDAGDVNEVRFERRVADRLDADLELRGEHGADEQHAIVGAASVIAKVERDAHVAELATEYGEIGSGYPGDSATRDFLESYVAEHGELPACARSSWRTSSEVLAAADQRSLEEF